MTKFLVCYSPFGRIIERLTCPPLPWFRNSTAFYAPMRCSGNNKTRDNTTNRETRKAKSLAFLLLEQGTVRRVKHLASGCGFFCPFFSDCTPPTTHKHSGIHHTTTVRPFTTTLVLYATLHLYATKHCC